MSEERLPDAIWRFRIAGREGKKTLKIELFRAEQWRRSWRPWKRNMYPKPGLRDQAYWENQYRLRIDGRWHSKEGFKFQFFTMTQIIKLVGRFTEGRF